LSSTTDLQGQRGQVLTVFAGGLAAILLVAALAFDMGAVLLERRDQQNAADAAALAGARFLPANPAAARERATAIATANGFTDGMGSVTVQVNIPPKTGWFSGSGNGAVEVVIGSSRASIFAGIIGRSEWGVGSRAVAANQASASGPFAMLALHEGCLPGKDSAPFIVEGNGTVKSSGNIQVNSSCDSGGGAFRVAGEGTLSLEGSGIGCNVVGSDSSPNKGAARNDCHPTNTGATSIPDPLAGLGHPPIPPMPQPPVRISGQKPIPVGCPGSTGEATHQAPQSCEFPSSYKGETWRLFPGYYPGGINLEGGTFYLEPGIYYVAGGTKLQGAKTPVAFRTAGGGVNVISVDPGGTALGGGILIFNGTHPKADPGEIVIQGGESEIRLWPLDQGTPWDKIVIFQHRDITLSVRIVGGTSTLDLRGIIYAPSAGVIVEGNESTLTLDQIIAQTISIKGSSPSTITVAYDADFLPSFRLAGLVE
jgi:Flp pilus assembly protein TadG